MCIIFGETSIVCIILGEPAIARIIYGGPAIARIIYGGPAIVRIIYGGPAIVRIIFDEPAILGMPFRGDAAARHQPWGAVSGSGFAITGSRPRGARGRAARLGGGAACRSAVTPPALILPAAALPSPSAYLVWDYGLGLGVGDFILGMPFRGDAAGTNLAGGLIRPRGLSLSAYAELIRPPAEKRTQKGNCQHATAHNTAEFTTLHTRPIMPHLSRTGDAGYLARARSALETRVKDWVGL